MKRLVIIFNFIVALSLSAWANVELSQIEQALSHDYETADAQMQNFEEARQYFLGVLSDATRDYNNLQLELYSCEVDNMFRQTYLLHRATSQYKDLQETSEVLHKYLGNIDMEVERFRRLLETIRLLPPTLEDKEIVQPESVGDSLLLEADRLLAMTDSIAAIRDEELFAALKDANYHVTPSLRLYQLTEEEQVIRDSCLAKGTYYMGRLLECRQIWADCCDKSDQLIADYQPTMEFVNYAFEELQNQMVDGEQARLWDIWLDLNESIKRIRQDCEFTYAGRDDLLDTEVMYLIFGQMFGMLALAALIVWLLVRFCHSEKEWYQRLKKNPRIYANQVYMALLTICLFLDSYVFGYVSIANNKLVFGAYFVYIFVIEAALLAREQGRKASAAMHLYAPFIALGFAVTFLRFFFVPNSVLIFWLFPLALICNIWQNVVLVRYWNKAARLDTILAAVTCLVLACTLVLVAFGYALIGTLVIFWWQTQQVAVITVVWLYQWSQRNTKKVEDVKRVYMEKLHGKSYPWEHTEAVQITWFHDFIQIAGIPMAACLSLPFCAYAALAFYNAADTFIEDFRYVFFSLGDGDALVFNVSLYNIVMCFSMYFVFKYIQHIALATYKQIRIVVKKDDSKDVYTPNMNLATNIISTITWSVYVLVICLIMNIPIQALTFIFAGLATGIGFAMKDIINNLFYGIQLLNGRLKVGDYIICDNYRGAVTAISYQTTQMLTEENAVVSFTNADLFTKNFQNLTQGNPYEINRIFCSIAYGSDVALAEKLIREAIEPLNTQDKYGRPLLSPKDGIRIEMRELEDSGILMAARFGVVAQKRTWFLPVARKAVYVKLQEGGIKIPFPQCELHMSEPIK